MREIKFRAWDKSNETMCYVEKILDFKDNMHFILDDPNADFLGNHYGANTDWVELMQYTGLKDKNGKEIYESDIVKVSEEFGDGYIPLIVDFKDGCFVLRRINYLEDYSPMFEYDLKQVYEIIGNKYQNPEILDK